MKRCHLCPVRFRLITMMMWSCVCTTQPLHGQDAQGNPASLAAEMLEFGGASRAWSHPDGRFWFVSGVHRSFGLKELDEPWVHAGFKRSRTSFALGGSVLGWSQMRHWISQVSAQHATKGISAGVKAELWVLQLQKPYRNDKAVLLSGHLQKVIPVDVLLVASLQNVIGSNWMTGGDPIERFADIALFHTPLPNMSVGGGLVASDQFPIDYRGVLLWKPHQILAVSLGAGTMPSRFEIGMRIDRGGFLTGVTMAKITDEPLGWRQNYWIGRLVQ